MILVNFFFLEQNHFIFEITQLFTIHMIIISATFDNYVCIHCTGILIDSIQFNSSKVLCSF
jgi:hypothetical protein